MPITNYSVLAGDPTAGKVVSGSSEHYQITMQAPGWAVYDSGEYSIGGWVGGAVCDCGGLHATGFGRIDGVADGDDCAEE